MRFLILVLALGLAMTGCTGRAPRARDAEQVPLSERTVLRLSHPGGEDTPNGQAARLFAATLKERSDGRFEVQVSASGSLLRASAPHQEIRALRDGKVHFVVASASVIAEVVPEWQLLNLPFLFPSQQALGKIMSGGVGDHLRSQLAASGLMGLAEWNDGFAHWVNRVRPIRQPRDLATLTMRVQSTTRAATYLTLGATVKVMPLESFARDGLDGKTVDGAEDTPANLMAMQAQRVFWHMTLSGHVPEISVVLVSPEWWQTLDASERGLIATTLETTTRWHRENASRLQDHAVGLIRGSGLVTVQELTAADREPWMRALEPLHLSTPGYLRDTVADVRRQLVATRG